MDGLKKKIGIASIVLILAFVGGMMLSVRGPLTWPQALEQYGGPSAYKSLDFNKPLAEQTGTVEIAGRRFEIPKMYIESTQTPDDVYMDSILLTVVWPEMISLFDLKTKDNYRKVVREERRSGGILLEAQSDRPSLDKQIANLRRSLTKEEFIGKEDGLELYLHYHGPKERPELWMERYLERDKDGHLLSYNECRAGQFVIFPVCSHKFIDGGLIYKISYNKKRFFPEWREQRRRAIDFIDSLEIIDSEANG
ncbi:MAG: hypothetical protein MRJ68_09360 [Nitrospira sp.]|nr:hypothetical protein [Nitrospira sp.]